MRTSTLAALAALYLMSCTNDPNRDLRDFGYVLGEVAEGLNRAQAARPRQLHCTSQPNGAGGFNTHCY